MRADGTKIISVTSGKGGVGKTVIAVNLAIVLAQRGHSVLLFDADVGFANAEILMGIVPKYTIKDFLRGKISLEETIFRTPFQVDLISSGMDVEDIITFNLQTKSDLYNEFQRIVSRYEYIVFDFPPGFNEKLEEFYVQSDHLVLVTTTEPTSLVNAYTFLKIMTIKGLDPESFHLVVNMVKDMRDGRRIADKFIAVVEKFTGVLITSAHVVKNDSTVKESVTHQVPFVVSKANSQPVFAIHGIADTITKKAVQRKLSFFDRLRMIFGG
ncbi:MinD/ParA family protein [Pseudothermotoga thermarum]|uniref:Cobyrinic acid ac-diamide synthase n=1 Tax=Pseudothermotoga thermarum DSM 5069 TaxID=688269 RepID=F7YXY8_9THEM|nr:MinD/ParA family protein [Pseudothermotoga thermarum]AEH50787.1 cobyrinic acid ac-diamide synthase [Pseudothermotoga thermarum DSM 5069]